MPEVLVVDRIRCDGAGLCSELLPELITLDDWGYPIVWHPAVPRGLRSHALSAVDACPVLALRLADVPATSGTVARASGAGPAFVRARPG